MKTFVVRWVAIVALMLPLVSSAAAPAQVESWKAGFPAASPSDSAPLHQMIAGYQQAVNRVVASAPKTLALLKDKLSRDQTVMNNLLHPAKPNPKVTAAMRADAEEGSKWLNEKFAPYLAKAPF